MTNNLSCNCGKPAKIETQYAGIEPYTYPEFFLKCSDDQCSVAHSLFTCESTMVKFYNINYKRSSLGFTKNDYQVNFNPGLGDETALLSVITEKEGKVKVLFCAYGEEAVLLNSLINKPKALDIEEYAKACSNAYFKNQAEHDEFHKQMKALITK